MYINYKLVLKNCLVVTKKLVAAGQITVNRATRKIPWVRILSLSKMYTV
jgi:hypothetical protein